LAGLVVRPRSGILHGHDWVYSTEILKTFGNPQPGDTISIKDGRDRLLGSAIYNPRSKIVARRFSRRRQEIDDDFLKRRVQRAIAWRQDRHLRPELCRLIWGEADGLPGVIADRYGDTIVLQTNTLSMDLHRESLAALLGELDGVNAVLERNDASSRKAEGMEPRSGTLYGRAPELADITLDGVRFLVDFGLGHKTGLYLDQLDSYSAVAALATDGTVLDAFSNAGGFSLFCAKAGAREVTAIESGHAACAALRRNAEANGLAVDLLEEDAFKALPMLQRQGAKYDLVILDPPSFTHIRGKSAEALRGYRTLHRLAANLMSPDGVMATFCCSHHISPEAFRKAVADGFGEARRSANIIGTFDQPVDHPVALHLPETAYFKGLLLSARPSF